MSDPNNHNDIDRMKMAIRSQFEESEELTFDDLFKSLVNPDNSKSAYFFASALEEMEHSRELSRDDERFSRPKKGG